VHNIHFGRIKSISGKEACEIVEASILDWGNENNWRTVGGSIDEDGETYIHDSHARWTPEVDWLSSLDKINYVMNIRRQHGADAFVPGFKEIKRTAFAKLISGKFHTSTKPDLAYVWYSAMKFCEHQYHCSLSPNESFNCLKENHSFKDWELDQVGLTDFGSPSGPVDVDELKTYIVFIDMHS